MQIKQRWKEALLRVQYGDVLSWWRLTMEIENHVLCLHGSKHGIEGFIVHNARSRIGGHARWVAFDPRDAGCFRCLDRGWCDGWVEVERHEKFDIRGQCF